MGVSVDKIAAHNIPDAIANSQSHPYFIQTNSQRLLELSHLVEQCRVQDLKGCAIIPIVHPNCHTTLVNCCRFMGECCERYVCTRQQCQ